MDADRFDHLLRFLSRNASRRGIDRALAGCGLSAALGSLVSLATVDARKKRKKKCKPWPDN